MSRNFLFAFFLFGSAEILAQPEARVYLNLFEWAGVTGGYQVNRWRFELNASWHQKEFIGLYAQWYQESPTGNGVIVFEEDVWRKRTATTTARVLRSWKKNREVFGIYYGLYLRYIAERSQLTEPHWGPTELEVVSKFGTVTSVDYNDICTGFVLGARGTIMRKTFPTNLFWDANLSLFPVRYSTRKQYFTDGSTNSTDGFSYTYLEGDYTGHVLQLGIGYKFGTPKGE